MDGGGLGVNGLGRFGRKKGWVWNIRRREMRGSERVGRGKIAKGRAGKKSCTRCRRPDSN